MNSVDQLSVNAIRVLSAETIQKANSGHPGLPLGAAPMAYTLFAKCMKHNPFHLTWKNRDRFVLSAGHGSALLYTLMHIFGYGVTMNDLKEFRQWGAKTPGHPEYMHTPGVETTTGPLGHGIANAVGMAMAEAHMAAVFNKEGYPVVDHYTYVLTGDGCLMEGVSSEACSLAGTLKLGKLIVLYDRNCITIEGDINTSFNEDVAARYRAYGWQVLEVADGNTDMDAIENAINEAKADLEHPTLIIVNTTIGYASPVQGTAGCHGAPLGDANIAELKKTLGYESEPFTVPKEVYDAANQVALRGGQAESDYNEMLVKYFSEYPEMAEKYAMYFEQPSEHIFNEKFYEFAGGMSTRKASNIVLNRLAERLPNLIGGSADLAGSNLTELANRSWFAPDNYAGTNIHFGIREFAMAAIANGMSVYGGLHPFVATFFVFSDYLKPSVRVSALMKQPVTYVFTHDSIGVGEDGPTHQPIEQLACFRAMPGVYMWRPADAHETAAAYEFAMTAEAPNVLALSRQDLPLYDFTGKDALRGAYVVRDSEDPQVILIGTGSELELCLGAYDELTKEGIRARVVSMPCMELFEEQPESYKSKVLPNSVRARVAVEAASPYGWEKYVGLDGKIIGMKRFGASAPAKVLFEKFGFTVENVAAAAREVIK